MFTTFFYVSVCMVCICHAVENFEIRQEGQPCVKQEFIVSVHKNESNSVNEVAPQVWYMPLYSRYELYHTSSLISHIPVEDLTDEDIKRACLTESEEEPGLFVYKGFGGMKIDVVTEPAEDGGLNWKLKGEKKFRGELYITLATDDYSVTVTCWESGRRSFSAASKTKSFDTGTRNIVVEHVTVLGFNPKNFVDYNYDQCNAGDKKLYKTTSIKTKTNSNEESLTSSTFASTLNAVNHAFWSLFGL